MHNPNIKQLRFVLRLPQLFIVDRGKLYTTLSWGSMIKINIIMHAYELNADTANDGRLYAEIHEADDKLANIEIPVNKV